MTSRANNSDWKKINQYRSEQRRRVAAQQVPAPSLISANRKLLRLAREVNADLEVEDGILLGKEVFKVI